MISFFNASFCASMYPPSTICWRFTVSCKHIEFKSEPSMVYLLFVVCIVRKKKMFVEQKSLRDNDVLCWKIYYLSQVHWVRNGPNQLENRKKKETKLIRYKSV